MKNNFKKEKLLLLDLCIVIIIIPLLLKSEFVKIIIFKWLSFSDNSEYKLEYVRFISSIIGTLISVYGALLIQNTQIRQKEIAKQEQAVSYIYGNLYNCMEQLKGIYKETKRKYGINSLEYPEDVEKVCETAIGTQLKIDEEWFKKLMDSKAILNSLHELMIYKYYDKLTEIQRALDTDDVNIIKDKFYLISWFITNDGKDIHSDIKLVMRQLENIGNAR